MTGLDLGSDRLIEIAALVTDAELNVLGEGIDVVIHTDDEALDGMVEVVAGLNLPMLVKLARIRKDYALDKAATAAQDAGRKYINVASQIRGD
jgi:oligoribonuclease (3'-5' exoribonuclease)